MKVSEKKFVVERLEERENALGERPLVWETFLVLEPMKASTEYYDYHQRDQAQILAKMLQFVQSIEGIL